jgi:hypothetical protein
MRYHGWNDMIAIVRPFAKLPSVRRHCIGFPLEWDERVAGTCRRAVRWCFGPTSRRENRQRVRSPMVLPSHAVAKVRRVLASTLLDGF